MLTIVDILMQIKLLYSTLGSANCETCFTKGECRQSHHIGGQEMQDEVECLQHCQQEAGET
jgi:hypothetical protein